MRLEEQGSKPTGFAGKIIGRLMNHFQTALYVDYFSDGLSSDHAKILDIGCGGGKFLKFLSDNNTSYSLYGLDHSPEMVALSKRVNKKAIGQKRLEIIQASVAEIPLEDSMLDMATAFETIQFWPETEKTFAEVYRILIKGGSFLIINRYPPEGSKWWKMANIKSAEDYTNRLENAGFSQVNCDLVFKKGWIIVKAIK